MLRLAVLASFILLQSATLRAQTVSLETLLDEMVNREAKARFPQPSYTCRQASSYDRDTVAPDKPGWFANWDRSQFVRTEERQGHKEYVMMDEAGPGCIVRMWATWHGPEGKDFTNGTLRIYLDGKAEPAIEGPIEKIVDGGGLVGPPLSQGVSPATEYKFRGHNLYLPIPYAKHCKVTYETAAPMDQGAKKGEALYYQINYRTYPAGTEVASFDAQQLATLESKVTEVQQRLLGSGWPDGAPQRSADFSGILAAGQAKKLKLEGPAAVRELAIRLQADDLPQALQSTVVEISFDNEPTVWCPVGVLFGVGYHFQPYRTWYTEVAEDGQMRCFWVMPFAKDCELTIHNLGEQPVELTAGRADTMPWKWDDRSMHFHATWRFLGKLDTRGGKDMTGGGAFDVNYVEVQGKGVYVGDTLSVFNGTSAWWGEGDEKVFVDGESFPSHIGTGTEDYYGYAWCRPEYFCASFHAQPTGAGNFNVGFSVNSRYRALDAIPFTSSIKFDMELWHWRGTNVNYAPATFWYGLPGAKGNVEPDTKSATAPVARKREDVVEVLRVPGALEGEVLKVASMTGGTREIQEIADQRWSDDRQLWWRDGKPGDKLVLEFPVEKSGQYRVLVDLTKARDYGIVRLTVDGNNPREFDRYHPSVEHDRLELGEFQLDAGTHQLTVEIIGSNPAALPRHMFGLDYLQLVPVP